MNILKKISEFFKKCKGATLEDRLYVSKLPFPAFICDDKANIIVANQRLIDLLGINQDTLLNWKPNTKLWANFNSGQSDSFEERFFVKSPKGTRVFKVVGHVNGRGKYCSVQEITLSYRTEKVISLLSRAK